MNRLSTTALLPGLMMLALAGCAEQREAIDRTQPNGLDKKYFIGDLDDRSDNPEFFSRNFVVDATESESLVGLSGSSGLERIRWEVTEDTLFGRRSYSITGGDGKGNGNEANGSIVAAYKIKKHFDRRPAYNPSTGEELNVLVENDTDRPWQQRQWFRVDWSENLVNSPVWTNMFFGQTFGDISVHSVSYEVTNPEAEDAPHLDELEDGYFDITSHFVVEPAEMQLWGTTVPTCLLMGFITGTAINSCDPQEAVVRSSYWRVDQADPDDDFEPAENTAGPLDIFGNPGGVGTSSSIGIVSAPHETYSEEYGYTDSGSTRLLNRHNLWVKNHQTTGSCESDDDCDGGQCLASGACSVPCNYDARRDLEPSNGTDDQCENSETGYEGSAGAQCSQRNRCTIPYRDRELKPVAYFMNPEMPDTLQDTVDKKGKFKASGASEDLLLTWNQALQLAVARAREVECRRTSSTPATEETRAQCHGRYFKVDGDGRDIPQMVSYGGWGMPTPTDDTDVLIPCHNPVREYDSSACGEEDYSARVGDLRHHFLIYWPYATGARYGGIGNWRGDPLTGHIVGAAATTIGRSATQSAAQVRDILMVALGELDLADITQGVPAKRYQQALRYGRTPKRFTSQELQSKVDATDFEELSRHVTLDLDGLDADSLTNAWTQVQQSLTPDLGHAWLEQARVEAAAKPLLGTEFEAQLITPNWLVDGLGKSPDTRLTDELLAQASPLRGMDSGALALLDQRLMQELGARGICHMEQTQSIGNADLYGLAQYYKNKYPTLSGVELADAIYEDLWPETYKGIQLHEIGHSLGLLHNFTSSYDSLNYNPQYWQLRTHDGASVGSCGGSPREGDTSRVQTDNCMGPRYLDPETDDELGLTAQEPRPGIYYFGHTSTMEYQNTRFFETVGLGQYDVMAMGAIYGRVLETMDPNHLTQARQADLESLHRSQRSDDLRIRYPAVGITQPARFGGAHYTTLARQVNVFDPGRCRPATEAEKEKAEWRIVHDKLCMPPPKDFAHWDDFINESEPNGTSTVAAKLRVPTAAATPGAGNVRWPYRFGGDLNNSYLHVNPFDSGADAYEVTIETIERSAYDYPFRYFRRERRGWTNHNLPSYTARRFYERLRSYHWGITFQNNFFQELTEEAPRQWGLGLEATIEEWKADDDELRPYLLAQDEMFRAIAATFLLPEPGQYSAAPNADGVFDLSPLWEREDASAFGIDASGGRFLAPAFEGGPDKGGAWKYQDFVSRAGYSIEKSLASRALTDGRAVFSSVGRDTYLDNRQVNINFRSGRPQAVDRLLGGVLAEDWTSIAPYLEGENVIARSLSGANEAALPANTQQMFPNIGYNQQLFTILYAQLFGRVNGDLTLANKMRIWINGNIGGEVEIPESQQLRFTDPGTGITYIARRFGEEQLYGKTVEQGIGSRMLTHANALLARSYVPALNEDGEVILDEFGRPELTTDESGQVIESDQTEVLTRLRKYVGLIDANVQIGATIGYGPLNWF